MLEFGYIDLTQVFLYVFWAFLIGLIIYLRREDRRKGYPLKVEGRSPPTLLIPIPPEKPARAKHPALENAADAGTVAAASAPTSTEEA